MRLSEKMTESAIGHCYVSSLCQEKTTRRCCTTAKPDIDLSAFGSPLEEQDGDVSQEGTRVLSQALMDTEVALIGAERHERTDDRAAYGNVYRTRTWDTHVGTIQGWLS